MIFLIRSFVTHREALWLLSSRVFACVERPQAMSLSLSCVLPSCNCPFCPAFQFNVRSLFGLRGSAIHPPELFSALSRVRKRWQTRLLRVVPAEFLPCALFAAVGGFSCPPFLFVSLILFLFFVFTLSPLEAVAKCTPPFLRMSQVAFGHATGVHLP